MFYRRRPSIRGRCRCCSYQDQRNEEEDGGEAKVFGEKAGYWDKHNELTDKHDEDMMEKLNSGLDNLLIFVSLGSRLRL